MDIRRIQGTALGLQRSFGASPTAAWQAFRQVVPWQEADRPDVPSGTLAYDFLQANPATQFYPPAAAPPSATAAHLVSLARLKPAIRQAKARTTRYRTVRSATGALHTLAFEPALRAHKP
jgi:hypothetical protein